MIHDAKQHVNKECDPPLILIPNTGSGKTKQKLPLVSQNKNMGYLHGTATKTAKIVHTRGYFKQPQNKRLMIAAPIRSSERQKGNATQN